MVTGSQSHKTSFYLITDGDNKPIERAAISGFIFPKKLILAAFVNIIQITWLNIYLIFPKSSHHNKKDYLLNPILTITPNQFSKICLISPASSIIFINLTIISNIYRNCKQSFRYYNLPQWNVVLVISSIFPTERVFKNGRQQSF